MLPKFTPTNPKTFAQPCTVNHAQTFFWPSPFAADYQILSLLLLVLLLLLLLVLVFLLSTTILTVTAGEVPRDSSIPTSNFK